jgi:hypothetical protein
VERDTERETVPAGWEIWPGPARGYIAMENDLPVIADALEALWYLRAQQREIEAVLASTTRGVLIPSARPRTRPFG